MLYRMLFLALFLLLCNGRLTSSLAADFYPIVSIQSNAPQDLFPASNLIQGPGVGFDANEPHDRFAGNLRDHTWVTRGCPFPCDYLARFPPPVLILDLGINRPLNQIDIWGYLANNANGASAFRLRFATEADGVNGFGTSIPFNPMFDGLFIDPIPRQQFSFGQLVTARYVELTATDNFFVAPGDGSNGAAPGGARIGLSEIAFPAPIPRLDIDRATGNITLNNPAGQTFGVTGSTMTSVVGGLNPVQWLSIASTYDADSGGGFDPLNVWIESEATTSRLAEATQGVATLADADPINFGGIWVQNPIEDIAITLHLADGSDVSPLMAYTGNNGMAFPVADLNFDGVIDAFDWPSYRDGYRANLADLSPAQGYQRGDLNMDGANHINDFNRFKTAFTAATATDAASEMLPHDETQLPAVLPDLPSAIAHWPLDDSGNDIVGDHDGTLRDVTFGLEGANLMTGSSADFNGKSSTITVPFSETLNPDSFTITLWARPDTSVRGFNSPITSRDDFNNGESTYGYILYNNNRGDWDFWTGTGETGWATLTGATAITGAWTHLAISYDRQTNAKSLYINGVLNRHTINQGYLVNGTAERENLHIGSGEDGGLKFYFDGLIDDVGLFSGPLTAAAIQHIADQGVSAFSPVRPTLEVDTTTGFMRLRNDSGIAFDIDFYDIFSPSGSLNTAAWTSIEDQHPSGFPAGDGTGSGWEELGTASHTFLAEAFLQGHSNVAPGTVIPLGNAYATSVDARDLVFTFSPGNRTVFLGIVTYISGN